MERTTTLELPKRGDYIQYFIASDWHTDAMDIPTYDILKKHALLLPKKKRHLVIGGDFLDCLHLMMDDTTMKRVAKSIYDIEGILIPETDYEMEWGNKILDELCAIFHKIYFVAGNHDYRYAKWLRYCPAAYEHHFDYTKRLKLEKRKIPFINYPDYLDLCESLTITHGSKHGRNHNRQHYEMVFRSVIYGHVHHHNCTSYAVRGVPHKAWSLPCMSSLSPEYQRKRGENNWSNGYATVIMRDNGIFNTYIHEIYDKELWLPHGKRITFN